MNGSLRLGSVLGITIRVHFLLLVLVGWLLLPPETAHAALIIGMVFGTVLLHELGHSLVAMSFGLRVVDITLWPLGGMARMTEIPESSKIEGLIAIAGPIVNFVLAAIAAPLWLWSGGEPPAHPQLQSIALDFVRLNLAMGLFNLVPAFPTDGGRILRAILGRGGDWVWATERAVKVGRVFAFLIGAVGALAGNYIAPLIALWLWWMGGMELQMVRARHKQDPFAAFRDFARRSGGWSSSAPGGWSEADPRAASEPARPAGADPREEGHGWSDDEIGRMERFRGPLRHYRDEE